MATIRVSFLSLPYFWTVPSTVIVLPVVKPRNPSRDADRGEPDRSTTSTGRGRGADYGWKVMEGLACYSPSIGCSRTGKTLPVVAYNHASGDCGVIGGYAASVPHP